jgi:uncharacterized protein (TIGR02597 family)
MNRFVCLGLSLWTALAFAKPNANAFGVTLAWDPNSEPDIAGYRIYYGVLGLSFHRIDVGNVTSYSIKTLTHGFSYRFHVTAYNTQGLESVPSPEVQYIAPSLPILAMDSDGDGLSDTFELSHGFDMFDPSDGSADVDGDGLSNRDEYIAGTDPQQSSSALRILSMVKLSEGLGIRFPSDPSRIYGLEANDDYPDGPWEAIPTSEFHENGITEAIDSYWNFSARRVYRVVVKNVSGAVAYSPVAGFIRMPLLPDTDTMVSAPLFRPAAFSGTVLSYDRNSVRLRNAAWTQNQFVYAAGSQTNTYFLLIRGGAREGEIFTIAANSEDTLALSLFGDTLIGLNPGDPVSIVPYWTLGTLFPNGEGIMPSEYPAIRNTEVIMPDLAVQGVNGSAAHTYYFWNNAWREVGAGSASKNDDVILPDQYFWVRHKGGDWTEMLLFGEALTTRWRALVFHGSGMKQDNLYAIPRAGPVSLNASGLIQSGAFRTSPSVAIRLDELLVFDNYSFGQNKSAAATYYHWNGAWRRVGFGSANVGDDPVFQPGTGFIIRSGPGAGPVVWTNPPNY